MPFLYHANEVFKRRELFTKHRDFQFALAGSLMTDLEWVAGLKGAHEKALEFYIYLLKKDKKYAPLALGMYIHAITDKYIEPSYVDDDKVVALARDIIQRHDPGRASLSFANHVLVEQAIDYNIALGNRRLVPVLRRALKRVYKEKHLEKISVHMENFFGTKKETIKEKLSYFNPHTKRPLLKIEDYADIPGHVKIWIGNMFYQINEKTIHNMYWITLLIRFLWFDYWQDKKKLQHMIAEAREKINDFHDIIGGFQSSLDDEMKTKLGLLQHSFTATFTTTVFDTKNVLNTEALKEQILKEKIVAIQEPQLR